ncbi:U3 small nucleolar RNA-associated protein 6 homolog [Eumeta japonica]|uniref:U3 small nucleolar RNA-associated protein 6 homolog n=1 Tax=Eumeta variegata TaxID=151549 RepID=A0A4C1VGR1_EUMVA|nr:U3 small nucleolar RNA-associated protein 6 homolog [Eumeta japonica]
MWQLAGKWEHKERKSVENAREYLLKGIIRHPESDILYLDLFKIELLLAFQANTDEIKGHHWQEIEEFVDDEDELPNVLKNFVCVYEEALHKFSDEKLSTKYIYELLSLNESVCPTMTKIELVKRAWLFCHENNVLSANMYPFGIQFLQLENEMTTDELMEILDSACKRNPKTKCLWEQKLMLTKDDDKKVQSILLETKKYLCKDDQVDLWYKMLDIAESGTMVTSLYRMFHNCESSILLSLKPKLLEKTYQFSGLKAARNMYEEFIRSPPIQLEVQKVMLDIEKSQEKMNLAQIKKCYELMMQHHGQNDCVIWLDYINFESECGSPALVPSIYRRAIAMLDKTLVDEFIKAHTLAQIKINPN